MLLGVRQLLFGENVSEDDTMRLQYKYLSSEPVVV